MNAVTPITSHQSVTILPDPPPIVLRFAGLHPADLGRFRMHDKRKGGDLSHVDHEHSQKNRVEIGHSGWIKELRAEVAAASRANLENHVAALATKSRKKQIKAVRETGLVDPWRRRRAGPLREGILTVNKAWFGGTGCEAWADDRVEAFRAHAIAFLKMHFPNGQLRYASSHGDEEAFHFHVVIAVWTERETENRGVQRLLQASANPLIADYEHAQDLAGRHFAKIGLRRGERHAAARRAALANDLPPEPKPRHVSPSQYRAEERRKAEKEKERTLAEAEDKAARIAAEAVTKAAHVAEDARALGAATVRKSRKRAVRDAQLRKVAAMKEEAAAAVRRDAAAALARKEEAAAVAVRHQREKDEILSAAIAARASDYVRAAEAAAEKILTLRKETVEVEAALKSAQGEVEAVEQKKFAALAALDQVEDQKHLAEVAVVAVQEVRAREEHAAAVANAQAKAMRTASQKTAVRIEALGEGLGLLAAGAIAWRSETEERPERVSFGPQAPREPAARRAIFETVAVAGPWLTRLAKLVQVAVDAVLGRERQKLATDAADLAAVRAEMGLPEDGRLRRVRAAHEISALGGSGPES